MQAPQVAEIAGHTSGKLETATILPTIPSGAAFVNI